MNLRVPETESQAPTYTQPDSRRHQETSDRLVLSELNPRMVVDQLDGEDTPIDLITFGNVREVCPKCRHPHLKLVLRQATVRIAHLFCAKCESCFDAHYENGTPALTL